MIEYDIKEINEELEKLCEKLNENYEDYDIELEKLDFTNMSDTHKKIKYKIKVIVHRNLGNDWYD